MKIKKGVVIEGLSAPMLYALGIADELHEEMGQDMVVTSGRDSKHSQFSYHYSGNAVDLRTRHIRSVEILFSRLYLTLNPMGFDVVLESDHIHIEYDPKGKESWLEVVE